MPRNGLGLVSLGEEPQRHDVYSRLISRMAPVFLSNARSLEAQVERNFQSFPANELAPSVNVASPLDILHPLTSPAPNQWRPDLVSSIRSYALPGSFIFIFLSWNSNQDLFREPTTEPHSTLLCFNKGGDNGRAQGWH